jgi:hypothetical protein
MKLSRQILTVHCSLLTVHCYFDDTEIALSILGEMGHKGER